MDKIFESVKKPLVRESTKVLSGPFAKMDQFNENGRTYPRKVYQPAAESLLPKINERRLMGELDHPISYDEVRLTNVSHVITECVIHENGEVTGKVELLDTPAGLVAQALIEAGVPLGISSRGLGATKKVNEGVEVTKLKLITFDLVAQPSFSHAILNEESKSTLKESLEKIEEELPLNESVETQSLRDHITRLKESYTADKSEEDLLKLLESELPDSKDLEITQLKESFEIVSDEKLILENSLSAKTVEINKALEMVKAQNKIIESLKSKVGKPGVDIGDVKSLIESFGVITGEKFTIEAELNESKREIETLKTEESKLNENMESLQEGYNKLHEAHETLKAEKETLLEETIELRKKYLVESRGLSWSKVESLLEGLTTEREIADKLGSITHLSNGSSGRLSQERVLKTLTESPSLNGNSSRLTSLVART